jgi:hypothetical protein
VALALAVAVAALPGEIAARARPARVLRAEQRRGPAPVAVAAQGGILDF